jgi:hypothetical protein
MPTRGTTRGHAPAARRSRTGGTSGARKATKAIPTEHLRSGLKMRSALEARWADHLDSLGIRWSYEPELVLLGHGGPRGGWIGGYLPDFRLDDLPHTWLEVKGPHFQRLDKTRALARRLGIDGLVLVGTAPGIAWRCLPCGAAARPEIGYGACRCGITAVGPLTLGRKRTGERGLTCRSCGRGVPALGVLGW